MMTRIISFVGPVDFLSASVQIFNVISSEGYRYAICFISVRFYKFSFAN